MNSLRNVLEFKEATLDELANHDHFQTTGNMSTHWTNLGRSLCDGQAVLRGLEEHLKTLDKEVAVLDRLRRGVRLKEAAQQLVEHRQHVRSYRDAMLFSVQTITL